MGRGPIEGDLKPPVHHSTIVLMGPPLCRETIVSRNAIRLIAAGFPVLTYCHGQILRILVYAKHGNSYSSIKIRNRIQDQLNRILVKKIILCADFFSLHVHTCAFLCENRIRIYFQLNRKCWWHICCLFDPLRLEPLNWKSFCTKQISVLFQEKRIIINTIIFRKRNQRSEIGPSPL